MKKKVLILSSSPRRGGNSDLLCDQFQRGAQEAGHAAEKVFLGDLSIGFCTGCGACMKAPGRCVQKDDMGPLLERMIQSDVIVMATPVYFYTPSAQMKVLIDRTCARYQELRHKTFCFILTAADGDRRALERTVEGFRGFTSCLEGPVEKGILYGTGLLGKGDAKGRPVMDEAFRMGGSL